MEFAKTLLFAFALIWFYISIIATIGIARDQRSKKLQRWGQLVIAWLIPFVGALFVLRMLHEYAPEIVPVRFLVWPFRGMVQAKEPPGNRNADHSTRTSIWYGGGEPPGN